MRKRNLILLAAALLFPLQTNAFSFKRAEDQSAKTLVNTVLSDGITSKNAVKKGNVYTFSGGKKYFGIDKGIILDTSDGVGYDDYDNDLIKLVKSTKNTLVNAFNSLSEEEQNALTEAYADYAGDGEGAPTEAMCYDMFSGDPTELADCLDWVASFGPGEGPYNIEDHLTAYYGDGDGGDTSSLEFEMTATGTLLNFNYVFVSEEFTEAPEYNDVFGLFISVNGKPYENIALVKRNDGKKVPVNISTLRAGLTGKEMKNGLSFDLGTFTKHTLFKVPTDTTELYNNCSNSDCEDENGHLEFNGISNVFNAQKKVNVGDKVKIKFVIADATDTSVDSYVLIEANSLSFEPKTYDNPETSDNLIIYVLLGIISIGSLVTLTKNKKKFN